MILSNIDTKYIDDIYDKIEYPKTKIIIKNTPSKVVIPNDIFNSTTCGNYNFDKSQLYKTIYSDNELDEFKTEDNNLVTIVKDYLSIFEEEFFKLRQQKLPLILRKMQETKIIIPTTIDYVSIKKIYAENIESYKSIKCDNIKCLDLFDSIQKMSPKYDKISLIIPKYVFILNKLDIHKIYIKEEFDEKYKDILPYLNQMTDDENLNYSITLVILDILFRKALLL
jgi:hypothetical protein